MVRGLWREAVIENDAAIGGARERLRVRRDR